MTTGYATSAPRGVQRSSLRSWRPEGRAGSSPAFRTTFLHDRGRPRPTGSLTRWRTESGAGEGVEWTLPGEDGCKPNRLTHARRVLLHQRPTGVVVGG